MNYEGQPLWYPEAEDRELLEDMAARAALQKALWSVHPGDRRVELANFLLSVVQDELDKMGVDFSCSLHELQPVTVKTAPEDEF